MSYKDEQVRAAVAGMEATTVVYNSSERPPARLNIKAWKRENPNATGKERRAIKAQAWGN